MGLLSWKEYRQGKIAKRSIREIKEEPSPLRKLNEANEEDLLAIKGVGPKTAEKIISNRPFKNFNEIRSLVSPIAAKKLKNWIDI